ncbi:MAG: DUF362 domain-containing protein [Clostridia bacterium]|nr:DUF362 domain-containing protein [Clostridia bacterium]
MTAENKNQDVSIVPCGSYEAEEVRSALSEAISAVGGLDWVKKGMKIAIKPNLVSAMKPDSAAVTHPTVILELTKMLLSRGAEVIIGDSPGGLYTVSHLDRVYSASGLLSAEELGAKLNRDISQSSVSFPEAYAAKSFNCIDFLLDADAVINVCKLKTHGLMNLSCACKNMFGAVPGVEKAEYHYRFPDPADFARMLVDLCDYIRPVLSVCDAIEGMEGNGPTAGTPRHIGAILASPSPHKLDYVAAGLIGLKTEQIPTLGAAIERGYISDSPGSIRVYGDPEKFFIPDYRLILTDNSFFFRERASGPVRKFTSSVVKKVLRSRPQVKRGCIGCGKCAEVCPAKAIKIKDRLAVIDKGACICCFCCQEFCPVGAMQVHRSFIAKMISGKNHRKKN